SPQRTRRVAEARRAEALGDMTRTRTRIRRHVRVREIAYAYAYVYEYGSVAGVALRCVCCGEPAGYAAASWRDGRDGLGLLACGGAAMGWRGLASVSDCWGW